MVSLNEAEALLDRMSFLLLLEHALVDHFQNVKLLLLLLLLCLRFRARARSAHVGSYEIRLAGERIVEESYWLVLQFDLLKYLDGFLVLQGLPSSQGGPLTRIAATHCLC